MVRIEQTVLGQTVVLDRPGRRNALTLALWRELGDLVGSVEGAGTLPLPESLEAFAASELARREGQGAEHREGHGAEPDRERPEDRDRGSCLAAGESLPDAVRRAAAPMRLAFPPHTDR